MSEVYILNNIGDRTPPFCTPLLICLSLGVCHCIDSNAYHLFKYENKSLVIENFEITNGMDGTMTLLNFY